jgi:hypothetical protein
MKNKTSSRLIVFIPLLIFSLGILLFSRAGQFLSFFQNILEDTANSYNVVSEIKDDSKKITLEEVKHVGYTYYLGRVDKLDIPPIDDALKTKITTIIHDARVPQSILDKTPIIILNSLAMSSGQYIETPKGDVALIKNSPNLLSEGGVYQKTSSDVSIIYINKDVLSERNSLNLSLEEVLTHEFGHAIGATLTKGDWATYYKLRNIPSDAPLRNNNWNLSPQEDFAEVYKNIFTGKSIWTYYGILEETPVAAMDTKCGELYFQVSSEYEYDYDYAMSFDTFMEEQNKRAERIVNDERIQNCRREVLSNPEKYPHVFQYGTPYKSTVDQETKSFVLGKINVLK